MAKLWIHGHAGVVQSSYGFLIEPVGYYLRLKAELPASTWIHYALPTVHDDGDAVVERLMVRMRTFGDGRLTRVHVWDGARQLLAADVLDVTVETGSARAVGDETDTEFSDVLIDMDRLPVATGVGVSLFVEARRALDAFAVASVGMEMVRR